MNAKTWYGEFRVLVCGGRDFSDDELLDATLSDVNRERKITLVVHGEARGADALAARWARAQGIAWMGYHANWKRDGKSAGPIRNAWMLKDSRPNLVLAFPGGKGTAHMVSIAQKAGVEVREIFPAHPATHTTPETK